MTDNKGMEPMLDLFIFETVQLMEQLEQLILDSEKKGGLEAHIHEIFRIMHTIKGSSAMMLFKNISSLAHAVEDVFYYIRENKPQQVDYSRLADIVLESIDFIKTEVEKIENNLESGGDPGGLIRNVASYLAALKDSRPFPQESVHDTAKEGAGGGHPNGPCGDSGERRRYTAVLCFEEGCEMENVRAFSVVHRLKDFAVNIEHIPEDMDSENSVAQIRDRGFAVSFDTEWDREKVRAWLEETLFLRELVLDSVEEHETADRLQKNKWIDLAAEPLQKSQQVEAGNAKQMDPLTAAVQSKQSFISVSVAKMDKLMDLVGELVISEAMVTQNPDVKGLQSDSFHKAARQLRKISGELQDIVMSIRMVPLAATFQKMNRILRDVSKKLEKEVELAIVGEETEVDKNIIEHISDPLMHLIRNAIDHGIEPLEERTSAGKPGTGHITLEAKNSGGDVWIIVKDDGKGLDREKILEKARKNGFIGREESEMTDRDIYSLILLPGFSTKDTVTELSGRGVGMDVVAKSIEKVGGRVMIDSREGEETVISIKIPLTLAIIDGMIVKVGNASYTIPTISIIESFRPKEEDIVKDVEGAEMIMVRGDCLPVLRLHRAYHVKEAVTSVDKGIMLMVDCGGMKICIFADALLGQQQVVVKALPGYIRKAKGVSGCTLLGDGSISLILDIEGVLN